MRIRHNDYAPVALKNSETHVKYCLLFTLLSWMGTTFVWVADKVTVALVKLSELYFFGTCRIDNISQLN